MLEKVVLITGSSSGIGEATALRFSKLGSRLVIHGTNEERLKKVSERCLAVSPRGYKPIEVIGDFKETKEVAEKLIRKTLEAYDRLDVLVNNAGMFKSINVDDSTAFEQFSEVMRVNLDSAVQLSLLALPHLRKTQGNIVNVSSTLHAECMYGAIAYCSAKSALSMFSKSLACELGPRIRVNCVSPGPVVTGLPARFGIQDDQFRAAVGPASLVGRVGEADEIARVIEFLASSESGFITGSDYIIDGGCTIKPRGKPVGQE